MQYNELMVFYDAYRDKKDAEIKHSYNIARWQAYILLQPHIDTKKGNLRSPKDLVRFDWDIEPAPQNKEVTEEQKALMDRMDNAVFTVDKTDAFEDLFKIGKTQQGNGKNR